MGIFKFYDTDATGWAEYDISGQDYYRLLRCCFSYCSYFSVYVNTAIPEIVKTLERIEEFRTQPPGFVQEIYKHYSELMHTTNTGGSREIWFYELYPEVKECIYSVTDSVFKWIDGWGYLHPEDPAFFRPDGSVFFHSTIHEGECTLLPRNGENVQDVISAGNWIEYL